VSRQPHDVDCRESGQAAAYVLGVLGHDQAERYRAHVERCAACRAEVARLQPVADALPVSVSPVAASGGLRERVMTVVRAEAELLHAAAPASPRPASRLGMRRLLALTATVAFGVGLLLGALAINAGSQAPHTRVIAAQLSSTPASARAVIREGGGHTELLVFSLPPPPPGKIYEIWLSPRGKTFLPTDALFGVTHSGSASVNVPGNLTGVHQVLVTAEPLGGSPQPTSAPVIVATLRSS
jgi:anti-sigma-K factor RskA